jgi:hypothetical protein
LAILNSSLIEWLHKKIAKRKGSSYEYFNNVIQQYPIKEISLSAQKPFIEKADKMLSLNKEFYEKIDVILKFLQQKY